MIKVEKESLENLEKIVNIQFNIPQFMGDLYRSVGDQKPGYCHQCAKCTSGCPATLFVEFQPHEIVSMARLGLLDQLANLKIIWNCTTCMRCKEVCPQDVSPVDVIRGIRRTAVKMGQVLDAHKAAANLLLTTGHLVPINEKFIALREKFGLAPLPPTTHMFPNALKEVKEIMSATGFDKLIGGAK
jgi:heterodisulfide reductase subunit C